MTIAISTDAPPHDGPKETDALARFRAAHASGVRRWRDKHDGEEIEVLEVTETSGVPCVRIRTPSGEYSYTMRSSINWDPMPNA